MLVLIPFFNLPQLLGSRSFNKYVLSSAMDTGDTVVNKTDKVGVFAVHVPEGNR